MYDSNMQQPPPPHAAGGGGGGQPAPTAYPPNMNNNQLNPSSSYGPNYNASGQWTTGLCDCCDNKSNCCITCFCPCVTFGQIAEIVDRGSSSCGTSGALYALILGISGMQWIYSCFYRTKLRAQYGLPKRPCNDCLVHWCCEPCAICQEYRELKNRGFDMRIGWEENMQRQGMGTVSAPPVIQAGMSR